MSGSDFEIINGVPTSAGRAFDPLQEWPETWRRGAIIKGLGGAKILPFRAPGANLRRITYRGETWWETVEARKFIGPAEARKGGAA